MNFNIIQEPQNESKNFSYLLSGFQFERFDFSKRMLQVIVSYPFVSKSLEAHSHLENLIKSCLQFRLQTSVTELSQPRK